MFGNLIERWKADARVQWFVRSMFALFLEPIRLLINWRHSSRPPKRHQQLYVRPNEIEHRIDSEQVRIGRMGDLAGRVLLPGDWVDMRRQLGNGQKRRSLIGLAQGLDPVASGYIAYMQKRVQTGSSKGCTTLPEIERRAKKLEAMVAELRRTKRLRERRELDPWAFRERHGISVAVGRDGEVMRASDGTHRLAFSQTLGLSAIPVSVVAVHPEALQNGAWDRLVTTSESLAAQVRGQASETEPGR